MHPSLAKRGSEPSQYPSLKNNDYGERYAVFLNHRIDLVTLRLFSWLISQQRIHSLKLSSNSLEHEADEVRRLLEKEGTSILMQIKSAPYISSGTLFWNTPEGESSS